ncbi:hypothetical protein [Ralstonia phage RP31]|uniref:Uncharacterized protein n=2 Tax=Ripduovirus RP12 TaxID=2560700 RepID=A0A1L7N142_9CAUD|nr:hypothetical protein FDH28_gp198 [Ralstonia phage RP12]BAW19197.1 hypothetical protein [Ralstonia phage RP12]BAW19483.1 hypothetical protein [Ralstonia phage RP31]
MARNLELYLKDAKSHLRQATSILEDNAPYSVQEIKSAAKQAEQAAMVLNQLAGALDAAVDPHLTKISPLFNNR